MVAFEAFHPRREVALQALLRAQDPTKIPLKAPGDCCAVLGAANAAGGDTGGLSAANGSIGFISASALAARTTSINAPSTDRRARAVCARMGRRCI